MLEDCIGVSKLHEHLDFLYSLTYICTRYMHIRYVNVLVFQIYLKHILFCKYFAAISVASSVEVTLQIYFYYILQHSP